MKKIKKFRLAICLITVLAVVGIVFLRLFNAVGSSAVPKHQYTIVIDPGHGGRDDGCSGAKGTKESEINLKIAKKLEKILKDFGVNIFLTRKNSNGLYDANAENFKISDMEKRIEIINRVKADMVVSIHQNSFSDSSQRGAQVFYQEKDEISKNFAKCVQSELVHQVENSRTEANFGDYYILKESKLPAVIVECGYLTNESEEALLITEEYQSRIAYAIACGIIKFFGITSLEN